MSKKLARNVQNDVLASIQNLNSPLTEQDKAVVEELMNTTLHVDESRLEKVLDEEAAFITLESYNDTIDIRNFYAAPEEWNLWHKYSTEKMIELVESILTLGLQQNFVVWEIPQTVIPEIEGQKGQMVLTGHNRLEACLICYELTKESKYLYQNTKVYKAQSLTKDLALRIIDDTNGVSREITSKEKSDYYIRKAEYIRSSSHEEMSVKQITKLIAQKEGKSFTHVYDHLKLSELYEPLFDLVNKVITIKAGIKLLKQSDEIQKYIYENYWLNEANRSKFTNKNISRLPDYSIVSKVDEIFNYLQNPITELRYSVPSEYAGELDKIIRKIIKDNLS